MGGANHRGAGKGEGNEGPEYKSPRKERKGVPITITSKCLVPHLATRSHETPKTGIQNPQGLLNDEHHLAKEEEKALPLLGGSLSTTGKHRRPSGEKVKELEKKGGEEKGIERKSTYRKVTSSSKKKEGESELVLEIEI